jgi:peptide-methionine (S)-S-oxide reductase
VKEGRSLDKIGLGGGCHWCTEAVFQMLRGVRHVEQGFIASTGKNSTFSEAVVVHFDPPEISLKRLIVIHLNTHSSTSIHSMREKYRSAVYTFSSQQEKIAREILTDLQHHFSKKLITGIFPFKEFRPGAEEFRNYYFQDKQRPFCQRYIEPKRQILLQQFSEDVKGE